MTIRGKIRDYMQKAHDDEMLIDEALVEILSLIRSDVIGEDEELENIHVIDWLDQRRQSDMFKTICNFLKASQRKKLE